MPYRSFVLLGIYSLEKEAVAKTNVAKDTKGIVKLTVLSFRSANRPVTQGL